MGHGQVICMWDMLKPLQMTNMRKTNNGDHLFPCWIHLTLVVAIVPAIAINLTNNQLKGKNGSYSSELCWPHSNCSWKAQQDQHLWIIIQTLLPFHSFFMVLVLIMTYYFDCFLDYQINVVMSHKEGILFDCFNNLYLKLWTTTIQDLLHFHDKLVLWKQKTWSSAMSETPYICKRN